MARIPSPSRRPARDENRDGAGNGSVATVPAPADTDRPDATRTAVTERTSPRDGAVPIGAPRTADAPPTGTRTAAGAAPARPVDPAPRPGPVPARPDKERDGDRAVRPERDRPVDPGVRPDEPAPTVTPGPRPRASLLATLGLVVGVAGALFVLTGTLTGYGIGLGAIGAVLSVLGMIATRRRHVAGKTDALLGIALGLTAVVVGVLAMTGLFDWPTTDGDWVQRFREWLDSRFVDRI
ncbi:hypothetical protein AB0L86_15750 [Micromonospora musae]|uniref:hypothetical protein n=1 Tax=Micromonospora musae TaxID=1894970 RepID=UPI003415FD70